MSTIKDTHEFIQFLEVQLRGPRMFKAARYSEDDDHDSTSYLNWCRIYSCQVLWMSVIRDELSRERGSLRKSSVRKLADVVTKLDVYEWLKALDSLDDALLASVQLDTQARRKLIRGKPYLKAEGMQAVFIHEMDTLLTSEISAWITKSDPSAFRRLHQVYSFAKRLSLDNDWLKRVAYQKWIGIENLDIEAPPNLVVSEINKILMKWFPKHRFEDLKKYFVPVHGPGAVLEGCSSKDEKFLALHFNSVLKALLTKYNLWENVGRGLMQQPYFSDETTEIESIEFVCEVLFVNKNWKTYRTISKESATLQWLQQAVFAMFRHEVLAGKSGICKYYKITTEDTNKWLSEVGSLDGSYATIDLTAASDLILWSLVQDLFRDTWLEDFLYGLRSYWASVPSEHLLIRQKKFAPMGSALCFPVLSVVCAAALEYCTHSDNMPIMQRSGWPTGAVYGDDIVCRTELAPSLLEVLSQLGLQVNLEKSFYTVGSHHFRESCGGEYLDGHDVTPTRVPRNNFRGLQPDQDPASIAGLIQLANNLLDRGSYTARLVIVDHLLNKLNLPILMTEIGGEGLWSYSPNNQHLKRVWNNDLQRSEVECIAIIDDKDDRVAWSRCPDFELRKNNIVWSETKLQRYYDVQEGKDSVSFSGSAHLYEWLRHHPGNSPDPFLGTPKGEGWPRVDAAEDTRYRRTRLTTTIVRRALWQLS